MHNRWEGGRTGHNFRRTGCTLVENRRVHNRWGGEGVHNRC